MVRYVNPNVYLNQLLCWKLYENLAKYSAILWAEQTKKNPKNLCLYWNQVVYKSAGEEIITYMSKVGQIN